MKFLTLILTIFVATLSFNTFSMGYNQQDKYNAQTAIYKSIYKINQLSKSNFNKFTTNQFIKQEILPLFDFNYMANDILRNFPNNRNKSILIFEIKKDIINTILQNLSRAKGQFLTPVNVKIVRSNIVLTLKARGLYIDLAIHKNNNKWQIFDIALDGQSLINYYKKLVFKGKL